MRLAARPSGPLSGRIRPPGDKSISHRALLLGTLARGRTRITGLLESADVLHTAAAAQAFGAQASRGADGVWTVESQGGLKEPEAPIDFGNSGTGVRLTMGAAAAFPINVVYVGDRSLSGRPMRRILDPLELMGAKSLCRARGLLPAAVHGGGLKALKYESPHASAQIKSAILLAALGADGESVVIEPRASRDHTERMLEAFGWPVATTLHADGRCEVRVRGGAALSGCDIAVPGDPSSAAFAIAAASIVKGSDIVLESVGLNPLRTGFFDCVREMDGALEIHEDGRAAEPLGALRVRAASGLKAIAPPPERVPAMIDEFPILAALAAFAEGETVLTGAAELRVKESDRIALMAKGLRACGVRCEETPDGMRIEGRGLKGVRGGAEIETHGDHRIAMSFLVLGLGAQQKVVVDEAEMIQTSFPDFPGFMAKLGATIETA